MIRKHVTPGTKLVIKLSPQERDVVLVEAQLRRAASAGAEAVVHFNLDDIDDLLGCVAAEANHRDDRKVGRLLDAVCDRLVRLFDSHTDVNPWGATWWSGVPSRGCWPPSIARRERVE